MHLGSVRMESYTDRLIEMAKAGQQNTREYVQLKLQAVKTRDKRVPKFLQRTRECMKEIVDYAGERGVQLGIEGRFAFEEIPSEREHLQLLEEFKHPHVGYWHDFGHIQVKHNLGFLDHAEWLAAVAPRFMGGHLHDTIWPDQDHRAPFTGGIDYDRLIPILPKETLLVFEMSPRRELDEIKIARTKWCERFGEMIAPAMA
jgi:sugar phosphate isomerase/epimerase